jgi:hypothetical protein
VEPGRDAEDADVEQLPCVRHRHPQREPLP